MIENGLDHSKPDDKIEYYIIDITKNVHKRVFDFPMSEDAANRISITLSAYYMMDQGRKDPRWIWKDEKKCPFDVKWVPPNK